MKIELEPVGVVRAERAEPVDDYWGETRSSIVLDERFPAEALDGIESFSHVDVLYFFHRVSAAKVETGARHPRNERSWPAVGIFAQRGKNRPNRIGATVCRVLGRDGRTLHVAELDAIDGTPVLDLKPVMREFLPRGDVRQPAWSHELMRDYWEVRR